MSIKFFIKDILVFLLLAHFFAIQQVHSQPLQVDSASFVIDVEEIMKLPRNSGYQQEIVSASKKSESLFEAPLAASVLTKEEIKTSGATNIMEALRLIPGIVVRQMANGLYNVHIRGMDWLPRNSAEGILLGETRLILVMIDNRPVFNYIQGTTFWETLPIGLHDIERIEVIRGPSSSLFGPNGVMGVINLITAQPNRKGPYAIADFKTGSFDTNIFNASLGYKFNDKFNFTISANKQVRGRTTDLFYHTATNSYQPIGSNPNGYLEGLIGNDQVESLLYPDLDVALDKEGINAAFNLAFDDDIEANIRFGLEKTLSYKTIFPEFETFLTRLESETQYIDTDFFIKGLNVNFSYLTGVQNPVLGLLYDDEVDFIDFDAAYDFKIGKKLSIKPSVSFRDAKYSHLKSEALPFRNFQDVIENVVGYLSPDLPVEQALPLAIAQTFALPRGIIDSNARIASRAFSLRIEYLAFKERLRLIGAIREDQFSNLNNKLHHSYQLITTFKLNQNHFLRAGIGEAKSSQNVVSTQLNLIQPIGLSSDFGQIPTFSATKGNTNLNPTENFAIDIGYRGKITERLSVDANFFRNRVSNLYATLEDDVNLILDAQPFPYAELTVAYENLETIAIQNGITFSLNYNSKSFWFRPFITLQETVQDKYSPYQVTENYAQNFTPNPDQHWRSGFTKINHTSTPTYFGGFYLNYSFLNLFTLNLNSYFNGNQIIVRNNNDEPSSSYETGARYILNTNLSYKLTKQASISFSVRDITNNSAAEYFYTDPIKTMYFIGFNFKL